MQRTPFAQSVLLPPVSLERDHIEGPPDAPVTLVEYGDFECPYCGMAYGIVKQVQAELGDDLRFVFRNFPLLNVHPHAELAAEAAEAAGARGAFWPMHAQLFEHQQDLDPQHLVLYAKELGIDADSFAGELVGHAHADWVRADVASGLRSGVNGTPSFFVDGVRYEGSWDFASLLDALTPARR